MPNPSTRAASARLVIFLFIGAALGAGAGLTFNRVLQLILVGVAAGLGLYAGWSMYRVRKVR